VIDVIGSSSNRPSPIRVTRSVVVSGGKIPWFFANPPLCDLQARTSIPSMSGVMAQSAFQLSSLCPGDVELFFSKRRIHAAIQHIV
jgi:hypothetical protein